MAEEESFKVTDRRGRSRDAEPASSSEPGIAATPSPVHDRAGGPSASPISEVKPDLQELFVMFADSAMINLGEAPDPATGERHLDLNQAREAIDLLLLLRDKTAGNRTEPESRLLEQLLYGLQMRYVEATRGAPPR